MQPFNNKIYPLNDNAMTRTQEFNIPDINPRPSVVGPNVQGFGGGVA